MRLKTSVSLLLFATGLIATSLQAQSTEKSIETAAPLASNADLVRVMIYQGRIRGARANPIFCDGVQVASLRHRWSYFVMQIAAGEHSFSGRHKENSLVLELNAGRDYYLRLDQIMTYPGADKLVVNTAEEGRLIETSGKLRPIDPDDVRDHARVILNHSSE